MTLAERAAQMISQIDYPPMGSGLFRLLTEGDSAYSAARLISINKTLYAEAKDVAPAIDAALAKLDAAGLFALLNAQAPGLSVAVTDDDAIFWNAYFRELHEFPLEAVAQAFRMWRRPETHPKAKGREEIFPTPAQLATFSRPYAITLGQMRYRIQKAISMANAAAPVTRERMSRAEMIAAGYLNPDGTANLTRPTPKPDFRASDADARQRFGAPISRAHIAADPGDVV